MKTLNILTTLVIIAGGVAISSCYPATGEARPPSLRSLPKFEPVPNVPNVPNVPSSNAVDYAK